MRTLFALLSISVGFAVSLPEIQQKSGPVRTESIPLRGLDSSHQYSLLYSLTSLRDLGRNARVQVEVVQGDAILASKILHAGDADFYTQFRVPEPGAATLRIKNVDAAGAYKLQVNRWPKSPRVRSHPSHRWQDATAG